MERYTGLQYGCLLQVLDSDKGCDQDWCKSVAARAARLGVAALQCCFSSCMHPGINKRWQSPAWLELAGSTVFLHSQHSLGRHGCVHQAEAAVPSAHPAGWLTAPQGPTAGRGTFGALVSQQPRIQHPPLQSPQPLPSPQPSPPLQLPE